MIACSDRNDAGERPARRVEDAKTCPLLTGLAQKRIRKLPVSQRVAVCFKAFCRINGGGALKFELRFLGSQKIKLLCRRQPLPLRVLKLPFA